MERPRLLAEESRQVAGHGRVGGVREADLGQTDSTPALRHLGRRGPGNEAIEKDTRQHDAGQLGLERTADDPRTPSQDRDGDRGLRGTGEEDLLGRPAGISESDPLRGVQCVHPAGQGRRDGVRQRKVHVVAAEQDVLPDGLPRQGELAILLGHGNQREVGRPAADVADEQDITDLDLLPPAVSLPGEPGIEGGLRFFQQGDPLQTGRPRGLDGQLASDRVERRGNGQEHVLLFQRLVRVLAGDLLIPGVAEVTQVGCRCLDRRDLVDIRRSAPRQDRGAAVHSWMREPALGRTDQSSRHLRPMLPGEGSHHATRRRLPGQVRRPLGKLLRRRQVEERGENRSLADVIQAHDLRDRERPDRRRGVSVVASWVSAYARAQLVVPRSIPTT